MSRMRVQKKCFHVMAAMSCVSTTWRLIQCAARQKERGVGCELNGGVGQGVEEKTAGGDKWLLPGRDEYYWTMLMSQHTKCGRAREALRVYEEMREGGVKASCYTFVVALKACSRLRDLESGRRIHGHVDESGVWSQVFVGNMLVDMYGKCGSMVDARRVFEKMRHRDVVSWNSLILGYSQMGEGQVALQLYAEMQQEGVVPDQRTFVGALKACSSLVAGVGDEERKRMWLEQGRGIHSQVVKSGFESDVYVATMLVDMYGKCGSLVDARRVFEMMPRRDVVSWNAIILAYAQMEEGEAALQLYARMRREGVTPDERTFVGALKACSSLAGAGGDAVKKECLKQGRGIHRELAKGGFEPDVILATILVDMYVKCGSMVDARRVFEQMPHRNVVSWNAIILGYTQMEEGDVALRMYARMQRQGIVPNDRTFVAALKACTSLAADGRHVGKGCLERGRAIHSDIKKHGLESDVYVANMLVAMYGKCGSLVDARRVFEAMPRRDVVSWNAIIMCCAQMEDGEAALQLYTRMQQEGGVVPNDRTFVAALQACSSLGGFEGAKQVWLERGRGIHSDIKKHGLESDVYVANALVDMYGKCGSLVDAGRVFEKMPHRDVVSWTAMIFACTQMEKADIALQMYTQLQHEGVVANDRTFVGALKACSSLAESYDDGKDGDGKLVKKRCLEQGRGIHLDIVKNGLESDMVVATMLVDMYGKCGSMEDGRRVFEGLTHRDSVAWNTLIAGYVEQGDSGEALKLYARMQEEGVSANSCIFVTMLKACGNAAALEAGREIHAQVCRDGLESTAFVATALVDMYGKCGSMVDAQHLFDALSTRKVATWGALIAGYARQGQIDVVSDLLRRMKEEGMQPDEVTFLSVLTACSHAGLVDKGQHYFQAMSREYGITPTIKHFNCMVDLLGRAGQLEEAMALGKQMPFQPDPVMWSTMLAACRKWNDVEVGIQAFQRAVRSNKNAAAAYVLMSHIYADGHMWEEVKNIHDMRLGSQAWKEPGLSWWTDIDGNLHTFLAGHSRHPESKDIYAKLQDLHVKVKETGRDAHSVV